MSQPNNLANCLLVINKMLECFTSGVLPLLFSPCLTPTLHAVFICISDVAVQLPDKKSIIMYVTSLFAVLPKDVSMDAIREVETLPRKYKVASEDAAAGLTAQVNCIVMFELWVWKYASQRLLLQELGLLLFKESTTVNQPK